MKLEIISKYPPDGTHPIPLLFIHRTLHGAWCWDAHFLDYSAPGAVLLSSPPPTGFLPATIRVARRRPLLLAKVNLTLSLLPLLATPNLAREAFISEDLPDGEFLEYWGQMQDDSYRAFLDMAALDLPKPAKVKAPSLVLGLAWDNMLNPSEIKATAHAYNTKAEIIPGLAHNSMLEPGWRAAAERILAWLKEKDMNDD